MGNLEEQLTADMRTAMKAGEKEKVGTLRMAIAALKNEKVAGDTARELTQDEEIKVLQSEVNKRKDSAEAYDAGKRPELAAKERAEIEFIAAYLPAPLTDDELDALVAQAVADASAGGEKPTMRQMGQVIKAVNAAAQGRAEGAKVAAKVKAALA